MDEPKLEYLFNKLDKKQPVVVTGWKHAAKKAAWDNSDADFWAGWLMDYSHDMGFNTYVA